jgi:hypothetical protein
MIIKNGETLVPYIKYKRIGVFGFMSGLYFTIEFIIRILFKSYAYYPKIRFGEPF